MHQTKCLSDEQRLNRSLNLSHVRIDDCCQFFAISRQKMQNAKITHTFFCAAIDQMCGGLSSSPLSVPHTLTSTTSWAYLAETPRMPQRGDSVEVCTSTPLVHPNDAVRGKLWQTHGPSLRAWPSRTATDTFALRRGWTTHYSTESMSTM